MCCATAPYAGTRDKAPTAMPPSCPPIAVGYCILLAQPLAAALQPLLQRWPPSDDTTTTANGGGPPSRRHRVRAVAVAALLAALLLFYAVRTVDRNRDWHDEERLFRAAQKVGAPVAAAAAALLLRLLSGGAPSPRARCGTPAPSGTPAPPCRCAGAAARCS